MTSEQFCLKWNNHQSTLVSVFDGLFESGTLVDCTLAADGQYLKAHKVVLCACSPYLEMILSQHYNQHPIVILKDVKFEELQAIMEYMYRGEVNVTQEQLGHFLKAAEMLQVKGLINNDRSSGASAQIVSSPMRAKDASDVKTAFKKKDLQSSSKSSTSGQLSSVDTLDLIPSKLVIDIPPISPVNNAKDNSVSPNPLKRKKSFQLLSEVKSVRSSGDGASNSKSVYGSGNLTFEVDRNEIVNSQITKGAIKQEEISNDSYDSDGLVVDEDFNDVKYDPEPGPSNASGAGAGAAADDGCAWKALAHSEEHPESTKDLGALAAAMSLTRRSAAEAALRAVAGFDALRVREMERPFLLERGRERPYVCERCGRHYSVSYTLDRHKKYECGVDKQFFCRKCFRPFSRADSMRVHMKNCLSKELTTSSETTLHQRGEFL